MIRIADFGGEFDTLAQVMQRSWAENKEQPLHYTGEFLRSSFSCPGASFHLAPTVYSDGEILGFIAGFPRQMRLGAGRRRFVLTTFLTAASEHKGSGYGLLVWGELMKRARQNGFDGAISFCVDGDAMNGMIAALARLHKTPTARVLSIPFMGGLIRPAEEPPSEPAEQNAAAILMHAASRVSAEIPFARLWSREEAHWQCHERLGAVYASTQTADGRSGIVTGYLMDAGEGRNAMRCALVDDMLWADLHAGERTDLLRRFMAKAGALGARMAIAPLPGYADPQPLTSLQFRRTRRLLHCYLTLWNGEPLPEPMPGAYLDVV